MPCTSRPWGHQEGIRPGGWRTQRRRSRHGVPDGSVGARAEECEKSKSRSNQCPVSAIPPAPASHDGAKEAKYDEHQTTPRPGFCSDGGRRSLPQQQALQPGSGAGRLEVQVPQPRSHFEHGEDAAACVQVQPGQPHEQHQTTHFVTRDVLAALSAIYASLAKLVPDSQPITRFHAKRVPAIPLADYLDRIHKYFLCSDACFVISLLLIDRVVKFHPDFAVNNLTMHRVLAASFVVSAKFLDDAYYSNAYYCKVCGINLQELNHLEMAFMKKLDWRVNVSPEEYSEYFAHVQKAAGAGC